MYVEAGSQIRYPLEISRWDFGVKLCHPQISGFDLSLSCGFWVVPHLIFRIFSPTEIGREQAAVWLGGLITWTRPCELRLGVDCRSRPACVLKHVHMRKVRACPFPLLPVSVAWWTGGSPWSLESCSLIPCANWESKREEMSGKCRVC